MNLEDEMDSARAVLESARAEHKRHGADQAPAQGRDMSTERRAGAGKRKVSAKELRQRLVRALTRSRQSARGLPGAMPSTTTRPAKGHHAIGWGEQGRQDLVTEAIRLGVVVTGKTPEVVGKPGRGQYRTWKSLSAAVERARRGLIVDEVAR